MVLSRPLNTGASFIPALRQEPGDCENPGQHSVLPNGKPSPTLHTPFPPLLVHIYLCAVVTPVNRSDKDPLGERAQERERDWERQRPTGEAGAYSSERCGAKERMWIVDFPPWVVPSQGSHKGTAADAFLLLVWHGGKSHFHYLNLSQGKPKDPSDACLPTPHLLL